MINFVFHFVPEHLFKHYFLISYLPVLIIFLNTFATCAGKLLMSYLIHLFRFGLFVQARKVQNLIGPPLNAT